MILDVGFACFDGGYRRGIVDPILIEKLSRSFREALSGGWRRRYAST